MITAFSEQLLTIDELRARMPALRARETGLKDQIAALDAQAADRDAYFKLAGDLEGFLARLRGSAATTSVEDRQRVLRAVVQDILIGPEKITIRHRIPVREPSSGGGHHDKTDTEGDMRESSLLRWGRGGPALRRAAQRGVPHPVFQVSGLEHVTHQPQEPVIVDLLRQDLGHYLVIQGPETIGDIALDEPGRPGPGISHLTQCRVAARARTKTVGAVGEHRLVVGIQQEAYHFAK